MPTGPTGAKMIPHLRTGNFKNHTLSIYGSTPPAMLRDHASVKPSTVEPQHHNTHNHKVYTPHQNLRFIKITQRNTNFHKTKSTVFLRRTDASNNVRFCKTFWNKNERYLKSNDISTTLCHHIKFKVDNRIDFMMYFEFDNDDMESSKRRSILSIASFRSKTNWCL